MGIKEFLSDLRLAGGHFAQPDVSGGGRAAWIYTEM